jgi:hypothetical protein
MRAFTLSLLKDYATLSSLRGSTASGLFAAHLLTVTLFGAGLSLPLTLAFSLVCPPWIPFKLPLSLVLVVWAAVLFLSFLSGWSHLRSFRALPPAEVLVP